MQAELPKDEFHVSENLPTTEPRNDDMDPAFANRLHGRGRSFERRWMGL